MFKEGEVEMENGKIKIYGDFLTSCRWSRLYIPMLVCHPIWKAVNANDILGLQED
jgi:hypothetical protein